MGDLGSNNVKPIREVKREADEGTVGLLTELLDRAKRGEVLRIIGVAELIGEEFSEFYSDKLLATMPVRLLGYLRVLQMRVERQIPLEPPVATFDGDGDGEDED